MTYLANMTAASKFLARKAIARHYSAAPFLLICLLAFPVCAQTNQQDRSTAAIANALKQRTEIGPAADFVERTRPPTGSLGYIPVNAPRREPSGRVLNRDQIQAMEAELDAARSRHDAIGKRLPPKQILRSAAGDSRIAVKKKQPARCVLTCEIK